MALTNPLRVTAAAITAAAAACSNPARADGPTGTPHTTPRDASAPAPPPPSASPNATAALPERVTFADALADLWPRGGAAGAPDTSRCDHATDPVACALDLRWSAWPDALTTVTALWRDLGTVCGVERGYTMDGGYRGMVQIVPQEPVGRYARHLAWVDRALRDQDAFYRLVASRAPRPIAYRWTGFGIRFHRTANTHTPAAYAAGWTFAYNVEGGINDSLPRIRETLIHEVFHSNDGAHNGWSHRVLQPIYDAVLAHCGPRPACLRPYAPTLLRVRRTGMYYAFQRGNSDEGEYAATLAERYYLETTGQWPGTPFKCGPPENARAWQALIDEFFGGYDPAPACGTNPPAP